MAQPTFDLVVVGAGPAGQTAAVMAAEQGRRVALVERDRLGGTCHNYGCDPTKTLLHVAHVLHTAQHAARFGLRIASAEADWDAVQRWVAQVLEQLQGGSHAQAWRQQEQQGITMFRGSAAFQSAHEIRIGEQVIRAERIILAPGTVAAIPAVDGLEAAGCLTNVEAVTLPALPRRLAILGAGPIGVEFAQLFRRFDVEVTLLEHDARPLGTEDGELAEQLCDLLRGEGIRFEAGVTVERVTRDGDAKRVAWRHADGSSGSLLADAILVSAGRVPALDGLNLAAGGVEADEKGIAVDASLRTSAPHIWAVGDAASPYQFTHVAEAQGRLAAHNAFAAEPQPFEPRAIPWVVYTSPELAHVGMTEDALRDAGTPYRVARSLFRDNDRARTAGAAEGLVKLLVGTDDRLLGGHILSAGAGELIAPLALAMQADLTVRQLADLMLPYPTFAAALVEAARSG
jgi:pyruvate/2-oxoglutarate dehydrogenase complex dihydrolipoamide dehydrogenase (E3) component